MSTRISPVVAAQGQGHGTFSVQSIDLRALGVHASPIAVFDDFRVRGRPFGPHPHAGFSAVTYVFEDSPGSLRARDSLGNDAVVGPGGIVWTQAGSGVMHEETPADLDRELHGLQVFVNLSAQNKLTAPRVHRLAPSGAPEWRSDAGDRVRVVVGSFEGAASPLVPVEPFTLLDVALARSIGLDLPDGYTALVYVLAGSALVRVGDRHEEVAAGHALGLVGGGERVALEASPHARLLFLSGREIREPVATHGPFIMNDRAQIDAAYARFRKGDMGYLAPLSER
jgi:redox-sensitive bicupin YhaK (pirin superfamily)